MNEAGDGPAAASAVRRFYHHPYAACMVSALLGAASVAGFEPVAWFALPIAALALMMLTWMRAATPVRAALHGYAFGLGLFGVGVSWVYVSFAEFGGMPAIIAAFATALFCMILALYPAAVGYLQARIGGSATIRAMLVIPALWTLAEWLRGTVTGFPWLAFGYSQLPGSSLAGLAPVFGVFGVSLAVALLAGCVSVVLGRLLAGRGDSQATVCAALVAVTLFAAGALLDRQAWTEAAGPPLKVALLQGNIAQDRKFNEDEYDKTLATYRRLALSSDARLIVWPETAIPHLLDTVDEEFLEDLRKRAAANRADMLIGIPYRDDQGRYYNSVFSFGASRTQVYSKNHLVPFGEFIPAGFSWVLAILHIPMGEFTRGSESPQPLAVAGQQAAVNICYEDAFGEEIIRQLPQATLLINVSNVAWFGHSLAPAQHLQISSMRALETGRPMLRATNTGVTAAIDAHGKVDAQLPQFTRGALVASVQPQQGETPFVRWSNWAALALALAMLGAGAALGRRHA